MSDPRNYQPPPVTQRDISTHAPGNFSGPMVRDVSAYAKDLARWENSPKHKFLFITEIDIHPFYVGIADMARFALLTQTASRPKLKFEHQEFNEYGIRKGVLTKTSFEPINLSFIDDNDNSAMQFFTNVLRLMSPITNISNSATVDQRQYDFRTGQGTITNINTTSRGISVQENGTSEYRPNVYAQSSGYPGEKLARSQVAVGSAVSIFKSIKIHHVHLYGEAVNTFTFMNPRLLSMDLDDLDMTAGEDVTMLKLSFGYDYLTSDTGKMTTEISQLVTSNNSNAGAPSYYLRRDLSATSGGPGNQNTQTTAVANAGASASDSTRKTTEQLKQGATNVAAALAQAAQSTLTAEQSSYLNYAAGTLRTLST
jgi:hypothetical protein